MQQPRPDTGPHGMLVYVAARIPEESAMICGVLRNLSGVYAARTFADTAALLRRCAASPPAACVIAADAFRHVDTADALRKVVPDADIIVLGGKGGEYNGAAGTLPAFSASIHDHTRFVVAAEALFSRLVNTDISEEAPVTETLVVKEKSQHALQSLLQRTQPRRPAADAVPVAEPASAKTKIVGADTSQLRFAMPVHAIAIGSSTGGPDVLNAIFKLLNGVSFRCPLFLTQHMPEHFTAMLAARLAKAGNMVCKEGEDGEIAKPGCVYLAPGNNHMRLHAEDGMSVIRLDQEPKINFCRPAVDPMMQSVSACYGKRILGIVLTGMGNDGAAGAQAIKANGGHVVIQDEAGSAVWGMPGAVHACRAYDEILTPAGVAHAMAAANHTLLR